MSEEEFSDGSTFADRYRIVTQIGSGAMGRVYEAVELHTGRRVALKLLHQKRLGDPDTVERFKREAEVLASIGHPCIVEVHAFHRAADGTPYLAMELLEGLTLKKRLQGGGRFEDPCDFQEVVDAVCAALGAAHARGVVHRDLKPDNIFLTATGVPRAKLVDFGLSRIAKKEKSLTRTGTMLGTPRYMAPEQARDASSAGPLVDLYSLGVIVFESLAGRSPYPAEDYGQLLGCIMEGRSTPLEEIRPELAGIGAIVRRALNPDPTQRFASCDEFADAYARAVGVPSTRHRFAESSVAAVSVAGGSASPIERGSTFDAAAFAEPSTTNGDPRAPGPRSSERRAPPLSSRPPARDGNTVVLSPVSLGAAQPDVVLPRGELPSVGAPTPAGLVPSNAPLQFTPPSVAPSRPPFAAGRKKKGCGVVAFLLALLIVALVSAAGGLAARAYQRGELPRLFGSTRARRDRPPLALICARPCTNRPSVPNFLQ